MADDEERIYVKKGIRIGWNTALFTANGYHIIIGNLRTLPILL